jgi:hypothetical protein
MVATMICLGLPWGLLWLAGVVVIAILLWRWRRGKPQPKDSSHDDDQWLPRPE